MRRIVFLFSLICCLFLVPNSVNAVLIDYTWNAQVAAFQGDVLGLHDGSIGLNFTLDSNQVPDSEETPNLWTLIGHYSVEADLTLTQSDGTTIIAGQPISGEAMIEDNNAPGWGDGMSGIFYGFEILGSYYVLMNSVIFDGSFLNSIAPPMFTNDDKYQSYISLSQSDSNGVIDMDGTYYVNYTSPYPNFASGNPVPEPATMLLLGSGLIGLAGFSRKKFKK